MAISTSRLNRKKQMLHFVVLIFLLNVATVHLFSTSSIVKKKISIFLFPCHHRQSQRKGRGTDALPILRRGASSLMLKFTLRNAWISLFFKHGLKTSIQSCSEVSVHLTGVAVCLVESTASTLTKTLLDLHNRESFFHGRCCVLQRWQRKWCNIPCSFSAWCHI